MHLLYLDESGNEANPQDNYFVLGGLALFERQTFFLSQAVEEVQQQHFPGRQPVVFHASEIRSGRGFWRGVERSKRTKILEDLCDAIARSPDKGRSLYAVAIEKSDELYSEAAVERATEEVCHRFDKFLRDCYHRGNNPQRGLLVFSEGRFDDRARLWVRDFRRKGTSWGAIHNLADIPYFASAKESRLLQLADLVAHAVWLLYEKRNSKLITPVLNFFGEPDGQLHNLVHVGSSAGPDCGCPACTSRRTPGTFGDWLSGESG